MRTPSRIDPSLIARWWWSVDRVSLVLLSAIVMIGVVLLLAAGPGAAARLDIENDFHFAMRQLVFLGPALAIMIGVSLLTPLGARRVGSIVFAAALFLLIATVFFAPEVNGSKRWLSFGLFNVQPSELLKPGFVIVAAWMLAQGVRHPQFPGAFIAMGLYAVSAFLLILQPDYGQAALLTAIWMVMFFIAGWSWLWLAGLFGAGVAMITAGYYFSDHLARRIDGFLHPEAGDNYQVDKAIEAAANGGVFGRAPGEAAVKLQIPDAHTDFIFAVAAEEFGLLFCMLIIALFAALVIRVYIKATGLKSLFAQCAVCGLGAMIGLQSFINIAVNLRALPAKGMTLPFISYGGSSLLATGLAFGLILALTRTPGHARRRKDIMP